MARKGWSQLSDKYRRSLERQGISRRGYESGKPLAKVAKTSQQRAVSGFVREFRRDFLFMDEERIEEIREELKRMSPREARRAMEIQRTAQRLYDSGDIVRARKVWERRDPNLPEWMFYYHGAWGGGN